MQRYVHPTSMLCYECLLFDYCCGLLVPFWQQVASFVPEACLHFVDLRG
jgi:hypothetical protein